MNQSAKTCQRGRPALRGISWYKRPTTRSSSEKMLSLMCGRSTWDVYSHFLDRIYGDRGFYMAWSDAVRNLFVVDTVLGDDPKEYRRLVDDVVRACFEVGIFSENMYRRYGVLTGRDIQRTFFAATRRRVCQITATEEQYLLIRDELEITATENGFSVSINVFSATENTLSATENGFSAEKTTQNKNKNIRSRISEAENTDSLDAHLDVSGGDDEDPEPWLKWQGGGADV